MKTSSAPALAKYSSFRATIRAYYGVPVAPQLMARLWRAYRAHEWDEHPALRHAYGRVQPRRHPQAAETS